jgi:uncharacterized protein YggE
MTAKLIGSVVLCAAFLVPAVASAEKPETTLSAQGTASLEKMPEIMRLKIDIQASAPELQPALAKLKAKREAAVKKLKEIGASDEAIVFEGPTLVPDQTEAVKRQMAMMRGQMNEEEEEEEGAKPAKVSVMVNLKLDLPLQTADTEALLVTVHELQEKIRKADVAGLKEEKLSDEEQEEQAEMQEQLSRFGGDDQPKPGQPIFVFVWKMSDEERSKLLADAFANAKAEAQKLAAAAGAQLGPLASLSSHTMAQEEDYRYSYSFNPMLYQVMQRARAMGSTEQAETEAIGVLPQKIAKRVVVMASYALQ